MSDNCVKCVVAPRVSPGLLCESCDREKTKILKAQKAIQHVLQRIRDDSAIGYYMGEYTSSFEYLTEAAAALWDKPVEEVQKMFSPRNPIDPADTKEQP